MKEKPLKALRALCFAGFCLTAAAALFFFVWFVLIGMKSGDFSLPHARLALCLLVSSIVFILSYRSFKGVPVAEENDTEASAKSQTPDANPATHDNYFFNKMGLGKPASQENEQTPKR